MKIVLFGVVHFFFFCVCVCVVMNAFCSDDFRNL